MIFNVGDKVKLTFDYIRRNQLSDDARNLEFVLLDFPCDMWYPYRAKLIGRKNKNEYPHIWYFRDDDIELMEYPGEDYLSPESFKEFLRIKNNPLPRKTFIEKVIDWFRSFF